METNEARKITKKETTLGLETFCLRTQYIILLFPITVIKIKKAKALGRLSAPA